MKDPPPKWFTDANAGPPTAPQTPYSLRAVIGYLREKTLTRSERAPPRMTPTIASGKPFSKGTKTAPARMKPDRGCSFPADRSRLCSHNHARRLQPTRYLTCRIVHDLHFVVDRLTDRQSTEPQSERGFDIQW